MEHPHSQLIALPVIPKRVKEEVDAGRFSGEGTPPLCDIIRHESEAGVRLVTETDRFTVLGRMRRGSFETWILPSTP